MKTSKFIWGLMAMSEALISLTIMAGCTEDGYGGLLENHTTPTQNAGVGIAKVSETAEHDVVTVFFLDKEEMTIATRAQWDGNEEQWDFRKNVSKEDEKEMKEVGRRLFYGGANNLVEDENTRTYTYDAKTFRLYRLGSFSTEDSRYKVIVVVGESS